jgi:hypothetical protein
MTLDQDEQLLVDALHRTTVPTPDLAALALRAARSGTRLRHRHQARAAVATLAVVGVGVGGAAAYAGGQREPHAVSPAGSGATAATDPSATSTPAPPPPAPEPTLDTSSAYAVLDAPGWSAPVDNVIADEKLWYVQDGTEASLSLNWRPSPPGNGQTAEQLQAQLDERYGGGPVVATTTIDGDPAHVFGGDGAFAVVGPVRQGRFLTLSVTGLTLPQVVDLATHVHRQSPTHVANH